MIWMIRNKNYLQISKMTNTIDTSKNLYLVEQ